MSRANQRIAQLLEPVCHPNVRNITLPKHEDGRQLYPHEIFGQNVFDLNTMERTLPKSVFQKFRQQQR
eukprot:jgi/Orpsp1_1/1177843/evm.model.c7180000063089.1